MYGIIYLDLPMLVQPPISFMALPFLLSMGAADEFFFFANFSDFGDIKFCGLLASCLEAKNLFFKDNFGRSTFTNVLVWPSCKAAASVCREAFEKGKQLYFEYSMNTYLDLGLCTYSQM